MYDLTPAQIMRHTWRECCEAVHHHNVTMDECLSNNRSKDVSLAREIVACIATERLRPIGMTNSDIARFLGMHRTTMLYALGRFRKRQGYDHG